MEKCSKKSKQLCLSLFKPSVMMLTTGFLCMASFQGLAAVEPSHNYGPNVESVMQNGKTITVKVSDSMGELIGANVLVKGTTIGNVTDMNGSVTLPRCARKRCFGNLLYRLHDQGSSGWQSKCYKCYVVGRFPGS